MQKMASPTLDRRSIRAFLRRMQEVAESVPKNEHPLGKLRRGLRMLEAGALEGLPEAIENHHPEERKSICKSALGQINYAVRLIREACLLLEALDEE